jgi:hypothetical protein
MPKENISRTIYVDGIYLSSGFVDFHKLN